MSFKDEITLAIQAAALLYGTPETISVLGSNGSGWARTTGGFIQSLEALTLSYADAIENRVIARSKPFDGKLSKTINTFTPPNSIIMYQTFGLTTGDTFDVTGSIYNDNSYSISEVNGNVVSVNQTVATEVTSGIPTTIETPEKDLIIEETLHKMQTTVYDRLPLSALESVRGPVLLAQSIAKFDSNTTSPGELKFNEIIDALRQAGSMLEGDDS